MPKIPDPVAVRHPDLPGDVHVVPRKQFASLSRRGWVEAKSSEAKAAVEANTSPPADVSKEGSKS